jgi:signal peptidase I
MWIFTPKYLKHGKLLLKGATRFVHYKRDLLPADKLEQINGLLAELKTALKNRDRERLSQLDGEINEACHQSLPNLKSSDIADNVEVFFVAIVVALGIRAYIAQPFQIPTASMQPTLNGYRAIPTDEDTSPNFLMRLLRKPMGETYVNVVSNHTGVLHPQEPLTEHRLLIFTYTTINFADGHKIRVWCPKSQLERPRNTGNESNQGLGFYDYVRAPVTPVLGPDGKEVLTPDSNFELRVTSSGVMVKEGQLLARGVLHSGDFVLVNKFAYHFRAPQRGEVFVFTTNHIQGIQVPPEHGSQHYIKRLAGVPGDKLEIKSPELHINGARAQELGFQKVMSGTQDQPKDGYRGYGEARSVYGTMNDIELGPKEYMALGDNSYNSSDSRVWGTVPQRNLVGPGLLCFFPFTSHWGVIR